MRFVLLLQNNVFYLEYLADAFFGSHQKWCEQRRTERSCAVVHAISGVIRMQNRIFEY